MAMRLIFFGSGEFGLPTLQALHKAHDVALVVTQPDRPAGRKRRMQATPIGQWATEKALPILKPKKVNEPDTVEQIRNIRAEAHIVVAFGQKIGQQIIEAPTHGPVATMNLHASLLPKYRGAAPINWAIMRGEAVTGNTIFSLVERMDAGPILGQQSTPIDPLETAGELHDRLSALGAPLVLKVLEELDTGRLNPVEQDDEAMTIAPKLSRDEHQADFRAPAAFVVHVIHGLTPWPGVSLCYRDGDKVASIKVGRAQAVDRDTQGQSPGTLLDEQGHIAAGRGAVRLFEVQPPGGKMMPWDAFQRGRKLPVGLVFAGTEDELIDGT